MVAARMIQAAVSSRPRITSLMIFSCIRGSSESIPARTCLTFHREGYPNKSGVVKSHQTFDDSHEWLDQGVVCHRPSRRRCSVHVVVSHVCGPKWACSPNGGMHSRVDHPLTLPTCKKEGVRARVSERAYVYCEYTFECIFDWIPSILDWNNF